ncbi:hybrid sensor histidine kinase/response regulator [Undibacterium sp.]|jgi:PAS domain S-box-containing protein|uniref:hybrid sensor histidine kinase/response regulator n=1 Tax=Undibacterium sp. TaxID=1914977 RepID=UPI002CFC7D2C|nr:response regulator [Undibacterium sp.]HTD02431.1 response regulator [Undibacterium sp.]
MQVRRLLLLIVAVSMTVGLIAGITVYMAKVKLDLINQEQQQAQLTARQMSSLLVLTQEYMLDSNQRAVKQWQQRHADLSSALASYRPWTQVGKSELEDMQSRNARLKNLFALITNQPVDMTPDLARRRAAVLVGQLISEVQAMGESTYRWAVAADTERTAREHFLLWARAFLLFIVTTALIAVAWISFTRLIRPLTKLVDATKAVRDGNFSYRLAAEGLDEFGTVSRAFNAMTTALDTKSTELNQAYDKLMQEALQSRRMQQDFESLFELSPGAIIVIDDKGNIVKANSEAHELFLYPAHGLMALELQKLVPDLKERHLSYARHQNALHPPNAATPAHDAPQMFSGLRYGGGDFTAQLTFSPLILDKMPCTIVIVQDVTEQLQLQQSLRMARDLAEAASRAKSEFVANMSHEIRTPMNAVLGMTYLLGNSDLSAEQRKYLEMIRASGQSLLAILNDILDFSKIEAGRMELCESPFQLDDVLKTLASIMMANASAKDLELAIGVEPDVPKMLIGDALRLQQVLINLTGNSIKFTERGEVSIYVEALTQHGQEARLCFHVRDTGIGMDLQQQTRLFSAFSQVDESSTRRFGGTGLGLAISKRLVELMGGSINVTSQLGVGTEFTVNLPLKLAVDGMTKTTRRSQDLGGLNILIVDDNATSRECLDKMINAWHWRADSADSAQAALACIHAIREAGDAYDALLIDWQMSGIDGRSNIQLLRQALPGQAMPVILLTNAYGHASLLQDDASAAADAILVKPITGSSLFDSLHEILMKRKGAGNASLAPHAAGLENCIRGARLLLVEDNPFNQFVAKGMLEQHGAIVDVMEDGQKAVEHLRKHAKNYALVLMDVQMPVMDGYTATGLIRKELGLDIPVVAMTAGVMESERDKCIESGMNGFIPKPIDVDTMLATIGRHLDMRRAPAGNLRAHPEHGEAGLQLRHDAIAPSFDPRWFHALTKGSAAHRNTILGFLKKLIDRGNTPVREARLAWDNGKHAEAAHLFHKMRGTMGTLGAKRFAGLTLDIEKAILENNQVAVEAMFGIVEQELAVMIDEASKWLAELPAEAEDAAK